ncbi:MAG: hypothetical protein KDC54_24570 [Lewinella sp.]|nr:hypothetical protein [Lewinella sp.]
MRHFVSSLFIFLLSGGVPLLAQIIAPPPPPPAPGMSERPAVPAILPLDTSFHSWSTNDFQVLNPEPSRFFWSDSTVRQVFAHAGTDGYWVRACIMPGASVYANHLRLQGTEGAGEPSWEHEVTYTGRYVPVAILVDGQATYFAFELYGPEGGTYRDMMLLKLSSAGEREWLINLGPNYGTTGPRLLQANDQGEVLFLAQHYDQPRLFVVSEGGALLQQINLPLQKEFVPRALTLMEDGGVMILGFQRRYRPTTTVNLAFCRLDAQYQAVRFQEYATDYIDDAFDLIAGPEDTFYFLARTAKMEERVNYIRLGQINSQLEILRSVNYLDPQHGIGYGLTRLENGDIVHFQRSFIEDSREHRAALFLHDADLQPKGIFTLPGWQDTPFTIQSMPGRQVLVAGGLLSRGGWAFRVSLP